MEKYLETMYSLGKRFRDKGRQAGCRSGDLLASSCSTATPISASPPSFTPSAGRIVLKDNFITNSDYSALIW